MSWTVILSHQAVKDAKLNIPRLNIFIPMICLSLLWLLPALAPAVCASEPLSALTKGEHCYMDCQRKAHACGADCREQHPENSREAFECDLGCGDRINQLCMRRCDLTAPEPLQVLTEELPSQKKSRDVAN